MADGHFFLGTPVICPDINSDMHLPMVIQVLSRLLIQKTNKLDYTRLICFFVITIYMLLRDLQTSDRSAREISEVPYNIGRLYKLFGYELLLRESFWP